MELPQRRSRQSWPVLDSGPHEAVDRKCVQVQHLDGCWDVERDGLLLPHVARPLPEVAAEQACVVRREPEGVQLPAAVTATHWSCAVPTVCFTVMCLCRTCRHWRPTERCRKLANEQASVVRLLADGNPAISAAHRMHAQQACSAWLNGACFVQRRQVMASIIYAFEQWAAKH